MFVISAKQIELFNNVKRNEFYKICLNYIIKEHSQLIFKMDVDKLNEIIIAQDSRAVNDFKIIEEKWRFRFMLLSLQYLVLLGNNYSEEIYEILTWPDRNSERKINLLHKYLSKV
jgi:hypothetical protein